MTISLGLNLEYSRHHNMSFEKAVEEAARIGYRYVEPMVHLGRQLLAEGGFMHSVSLSEDPVRVREFCETNGVKISALSSHSQLCKPDLAVEYLRQGIRWAGEMNVNVVNTSEGTKRPWTTEDEDFTLIKLLNILKRFFQCFFLLFRGWLYWCIHFGKEPVETCFIYRFGNKRQHQ